MRERKPTRKCHDEFCDVWACERQGRWRGQGRTRAGPGNGCWACSNKRALFLRAPGLLLLSGNRYALIPKKRQPNVHLGSGLFALFEQHWLAARGVWKELWRILICNLRFEMSSKFLGLLRARVFYLVVRALSRSNTTHVCFINSF